MASKIKTERQLKEELKKLQQTLAKGRLILRSTIRHKSKKSDYNRKKKVNFDE